MQKRKTPTAVTTSVLTLITIFFWAGFSIYRAITTKPVPPVPVEITEPLDPTLDTQALDDLSQKTYLQDNEIGSFQVSSSSATATPIVTATPVATTSATQIPTASPSATP